MNYSSGQTQRPGRRRRTEEKGPTTEDASREKTRSGGEPSPRTRIRTARILLADDHDLIRTGLCEILSLEQGLEVVGEARDGLEAIAMCRILKPDLVLMDVCMPRMDGLEATRRIKAYQPEVMVLMVSSYENADYLFEALKAGAAGYVLKDALTSRLVNAIRRVSNGESSLNQELAVQLIQRLAQEDSAAQSESADAPPQELTPRQLEVLKLLIEGQTNPQIAQALSISRATAKVHVEHIIHKLGVSDRTQAAIRAIELGLLRADR